MLRVIDAGGAVKCHGDSRVDEELAACKTLAKKQASINRSRTIRHVADELGASARHDIDGPPGQSLGQAGMMAKALHAATMTTQRLG